MGAWDDGFMTSLYGNCNDLFISQMLMELVGGRDLGTYDCLLEGIGDSYVVDDGKELELGSSNRDIHLFRLNVSIRQGLGISPINKIILNLFDLNRLYCTEQDHIELSQKFKLIIKVYLKYSNEALPRL